MEDLGFFIEEEIECNCGCGQMIIQPLFLAKMNNLRARMDLPLNPSSWNRCPSHNVLSGGSDTSSHLMGLASDIKTPTKLFQYMLLYHAGAVGFRGIGIAKSFIHFDDDPYKPNRRIWTY